MRSTPPTSATGGRPVADADLVVRGGTVVRARAEPAVCDVAVGDDRIVALGADLDVAGSVEMDAAGLHVLPGGVDPHVHCNEPGRTGWEGFATATAAMAAGGCTAFADMPLNSLPVTVDPDSFDRKLEAASESALIDFGLWGGLVPGGLDHLEALARRGALGFKAFLCDSGLAEFPAADDLTLWQGMHVCAQLGAIVLVHAESAPIVEELARRSRAAGRVGPADFAAARPVEAELEAISRAIFFAGETGCALHVVHVSSARGVGLVERARAGGVDVSCETCPHYLVLTAEDVEELGAVAKCAPPVRPAGEGDALWELVRTGVLPIVASDHSPCPPALKRGRDFFDAWGGIAGCQTTRQLLLARRPGGLDLSPGTVAAVTATNAAARFGLAGKGAVEVGKDADLALVDLSREWALTAAELRYRHPQSPFVGRTVRGRVVRTLLRGRTVFEEGRVVSGARGRLLTPARPDARPA